MRSCTHAVAAAAAAAAAVQPANAGLKSEAVWHHGSRCEDGMQSELSVHYSLSLSLSLVVISRSEEGSKESERKQSKERDERRSRANTCTNIGARTHTHIHRHTPCDASLCRKRGLSINRMEQQEEGRRLQV